MYFKILGPLEVEDRGQPVDVGGGKQRALLTILLLRANETVSRDVLIDALWSEHAPAGAAHALETHVSRLRKVLHQDGARLIATRPTGYVLQLDGDELDVRNFERLASEGFASLDAGQHQDAAELLRNALGYWRGHPLQDVTFESFAQVEIRRLDDRRALALESLFEAELELDRDSELVEEIEAAVQRYPLRERLYAQLMLALYRSGRQAEALEAYRRARRTLVEGLGLEPGADLRELEQRILRQDPDLRPSGAAPVAPPEPAARRRRPPRAVAGIAIGVAAAAASLAAFLAFGRSSSGPALPPDAVGAIGALDAHSAKLAGRVAQVPTRPSSLATGGGYIWVTEPTDGRVRQIDERTDTVHQAIRVGNQPSGVAYGAKALWVANTLDGTVDRIDATTFDRISQIQVGESPTAIAYRAPYVWVANSSDATVTRIDTRRDARRTFAVDADPTAVLVGAGGVWVTSGSGASVLRLDPQSGAIVRRIGVGNGPVALAYGDRAIWVANEADATISRIDPMQDKVTSTFPVQRDPSSVAVARGFLWVGSASTRSIWRVDPARPDVPTKVAIGGTDISLAASGGNVYFAAGGRGGAHRGGTLTSLHNPSCFAPSGVTLLDPGTGSCPSITTLVYDGLVSYARAGGAASELVPDLATGPPTISDGGTTYTYELRRGIRYSTGVRVRPGDIRRSIERSYRLQGPAAFPALGTELVGGAACLQDTSRCDLRRGVEVDSATNSVAFHLVSPDADFPYRLVYTTIPMPPGTPAKEVDAHPPPGTGPYRVASNTARRLTLVRDSTFRSWSFLARPNGYPDTIVVRRETGLAGLEAVEHGAADLVEVPLYGVPAAALRTIETSYRSQAHPDRLSSTIWLILNTKRPPFNDVRVRRALSFAIDRRRLVRLTGGPLAAQPTCQVLPPGFQGYERYCPYTLGPREHGRWRAPNLPKAKALVATSGTRGARITVWTEPTLGFVQTLRYVTTVLGKLGYSARLKVVSPNAVGAAVAKPDTSVALTVFYAPVFRPNASFFFNVAWFCTDLNGLRFGFSCTPRFKAMIASAAAEETRDPLVANALWARLDRAVVDRAAIIPLYNGRYFDLVSKRVGNYQLNFSGALRDQMWVR